MSRRDVEDIDNTNFSSCFHCFCVRLNISLIVRVFPTLYCGVVKNERKIINKFLSIQQQKKIRGRKKKGKRSSRRTPTRNQKYHFVATNCLHRFGLTQHLIIAFFSVFITHGHYVSGEFSLYCLLKRDELASTPISFDTRSLLSLIARHPTLEINYKQLILPSKSV
uniref:Uncharacterized protein TCIL3000_11_1350 n=1 Tax=Trypanosoma congolense (strain IL3000) TaxID=1068625 RepID=G0UZD2_TRYCI|nr:unnamed protein product [Trypanosoma congolense IL3000]